MNATLIRNHASRRRVGEMQPKAYPMPIARARATPTQCNTRARHRADAPLPCQQQRHSQPHNLWRAHATGHAAATHSSKK
jgi:hypothetical protein